jgi:hypothetical protein
MDIRAGVAEYFRVVFHHPPWVSEPFTDADGRTGRTYLGGEIEIYDDEPLWEQKNGVSLVWCFWNAAVLTGLGVVAILYWVLSSVGLLPGG